MRLNKSSRHVRKNDSRPTRTTQNVLALSAAIGAMGFCGHKASAGSFTWNTTSSGSWATAASWTPNTGLTTNSSIAFNGTGVTATNNESTTFIITGISFGSTAGAYTLAGNAITLSGGITDNSTALETVNLPIALSGANNMTVVTGGTLSLGGILSSTGSITAGGAGTVSLSGVNTYSGGTTISAGTLDFNNAKALGTGTITINGGTIDNTTAAAITNANNNAITLGGNFAFTGTQDLNLGTGAVTLTGTRTITTNGGTLTIGGIIDDGVNTFGLTKAGAGTLVLSGANTFGGTTTISGGTLQVAADNNLGTTGVAMAMGGGTLSTTATFPTARNIALTGANTITVASGTTLTESGILSGTGGSLTTNGSGSLILSNTNTYTGGTTVSGGTLIAQATGSFGSGTVTLNGGTLDLQNSSSSSTTYTNAIAVSAGSTLEADRSGTGHETSTTTLGNLSFNNSAILNLTNGPDIGTSYDMTFGTTTFGTNATAVTIDVKNVSASESTLTLGALTGTAGVTPTVTFQDNGTVILGTAAGTINPGTVFNVGNGTLTGMNLDLNATGALGTAAADVTNNSGNTLALGASQSLRSLTGAGAVTLGANTLTLNNTTTSPNISGAISGTGGVLAVNGTGSVTLSGSNSYTGGTTLSQGTLIVANAAGLGNLATDKITLSGGTLDLLNTSTTAETYGNNVVVSGSAGINVDRAAVADTTSSTLGTLSIGAQTLSVAAGSGIASGTGYNLTLGATTLTGNSVFDVKNNGTGTGTLTLGALADSGTTTPNITFQDSGTATLGATSGTINIGTAVNVGNGTLTGTTLNLNGAGALGSAVTDVTNNSGNTLALGASQSLRSLTGGGAVNLGSSILTLNNTTTTPNISGAISGTGGLTMAGTGNLTLSGANLYTGSTLITHGKLSLTGSLSNTAINVSAGATFAPGSGSSAGLTNAGFSGATLNLNSTSIFSMFDTTAGAFDLNQQASFSGTALTLGGATLDFDLGNNGVSDSLVVNKGSASVSGTQTINIDALSNLTNFTTGFYTLISAPSGLAGTFALGNSTVSVNGTTYNLKLTNSSTSEVLDVTAPVTTTATTYNLSATTGGLTTENIHVSTASTDNTLAITNTISNVGTTGEDALNFTQLGSTANNGGSITGSSTSSPPSIALGGNATNSQTFSSASSGTFTITPGVASATNATLNTPANGGTISKETVNVYNLATPSIAQTTINVGNTRVGSAFGTGTVSLSNLPPTGLAESLDASFGTGTGATGTGSVNLLAPLGIDNTHLVVGLSGTAVAGPNSGTIGLTLTSDGSGNSGLGTTTLTGQKITVTGTGYNLASANIGSTTINIGATHVNSSFTGTAPLSITNGAPGTFSESLDASFGTGSGATGTGSISLLGAQQNNNTSLVVGLSGTAHAGTNTGTIGLVLDSNGAGTSGILNNASLTGKTITVTGTGYNYAQPSVSTAINLGDVHVGGSFGSSALTIANTAPNTFSESLDASFGSATNVTAAGSINLLAAGAPANSSSMTVGLTNPATAGLNSGSVAVNLTSDGSGTSGLGTTPLTPQTITVTGTGYNLASMSAPSAVNFGTVFVNQTASQNLTITNNAPSSVYSENLDVAIAGTSGNASASGSEHLINAGSQDTGISVGIDTSSVGSKSGTVTLTPTSDASGVAGDTFTTTTESNQVVNVSGVVMNHALVTAGNVDLGHVLQGTTVDYSYTIGNQSGSFVDAANVSGISGGGNGYSLNFTPVSKLGSGQAVSYTGSFIAGYDQGGGETYSITYGDADSGISGAVEDVKTTFSVGAIVDPLVTVSDASDAIAAGRSLLTGTPTPGNHFGPTDTHTLYVIRSGPSHYVVGGLTGLDSSKGYVNIDVTDPQGNPSSFTEGPIVALFNFGSINLNDATGLLALESDLTTFDYTWFDIEGRNGANGVAGTGLNEGQLAFIPGYQLEVDLPLGGDPVLSFDFSKYSDLNVQSLAVVPEPSSAGLALLGGLGVLARRRRRKI